MRKFSATKIALDDILRWRDIYRQEMNCQIIHDSIHSRPGWTEEYALAVDDVPVGYGSVAVSGPWKEKSSVYEFFVLPQRRSHAFDLFGELLAASGAIAIEVQSNDPLITVMLHTFAHNVACESILFHDKVTTAHAPQDAIFRHATSDDAARFQPHQEGAAFIVEMEGAIAATGGILFHYNRPYGDIYMEVSEKYRRRGIGSFLVQELKRVCYEQGNVPAARCNSSNIASRRTLQKAGFVPCGNILSGLVSHSPEMPCEITSAD